MKEVFLVVEEIISLNFTPNIKVDYEGKFLI